MGLACLVFPGANHTRYEHSLGTMFVAKKLVEALAKKTDDEFLHKNARAIEFAALFHDVGHSPFSHVTEEFFARNPNYLPVERKDLGHEKYTELIIRKDENIKEICREEKVDIRFISKLAVGNSDTIFDDLLSSSIDVDKIDYVARDSYFCGLPYGRVDLSSLEEGIRIAESSFGNKMIAFANKHRDVLEGLLISRFYLATSIHIDEKNRSANQLLLGAIRESYDTVFEVIHEESLINEIKKLILDCMHFRWVDHDLLAFLEDPVQKLRSAVIEAVNDRFSSIDADTLYKMYDKLSLKKRKAPAGRRRISGILLRRVLQGRTPSLRHSSPLSRFSPSARYSLFALHRLSPYTNYLDGFKKMLQALKQCSGKSIYLDLTAPKFLELNAKVLVAENNIKNLFDISSLMRSLVSDATNRLTLSLYSYQQIEEIPAADLEAIIGLFCTMARRRAIKRRRYLGTDLILMTYYCLHQEKLFFEGDTRFQALYGALFDKILSKSECPYKELLDLQKHFGDLNDTDNYDAFQSKGYPDFFCVRFAQDVDVLSEMGLIYTRSEPVTILRPGYYPKRYERRISHYGRQYVQEFLSKEYWFTRILEERIKRIDKSGYCLIHLGT
jgi:HD superfamily phosphohydrolase